VEPGKKGGKPIDRVTTGEIPWTRAELGEAFAHAATLHNTPHDDWDRTKKGVNPMWDDGSVSEITFNPDNMPNQVMGFIVGRLRKKGATDEEIMSHGFRFMETMAFVTEHMARLRDEDLIQDDLADPAAMMVSESLIEVLATARYDGVTLKGTDREPERTFHLEQVIAEAKRLDADDPEVP
jgi:CRISPR-associated DxTHG motif protein